MTTKAQKIARIRKLADYIKEVPLKAFDMVQTLNGSPDSKCGTVGCIAGHASLIPSFQKAGLKPLFNERNDFIGVILHRQDGSMTGDLDDIAAEFFGMPTDSQACIFYDFSIKTPRGAASKLRKLADKLEREAN